VPEASSGRAGSPVHSYAWVIVVAGFLVTMSGIGCGRYLYQVVLPVMKDSLGLSYAPAGALASAIMVGYLVSCLVSGVLAVRFGSRLIIGVSALAVGFAMVGQGLSSWYPLTFLLMFVIGMGAGGAYIPTTGLVAAWFPPERRGTFMSITTVGANFGILITAVLAPRILEAYGGTGWRPAWIYFGISGVGVGVVALLAMRDGPSSMNRQQGTPASGAKPPTRNWGLVFQNRSILRLTLAYLCHGFFSVYLVFLSAFVTRGLGYSNEFAGNLWTLTALVSALSLIPWGILSDRWGRKEALIPCAFMLLAGILIPVLRQDVPSLLLSATLFGIAYVGPMTIITVTAGDIVGPAMAAAATGLVTMGHGIGQMAGPGIGGVLIDLSGSFYPGFLLGAAGIAAEIIIISGMSLPKARGRMPAILPSGRRQDR
ncbi:MAG: MFS transporter, partial [Dehalococcoidia bacterium]|nr:MFS transporter [Dehalococcoidia bacterium]